MARRVPGKRQNASSAYFFLGVFDEKQNLTLSRGCCRIARRDVRRRLRRARRHADGRSRRLAPWRLRKAAESIACPAEAFAGSGKAVAGRAQHDEAKP